MYIYINIYLSIYLSIYLYIYIYINEKCFKKLWLHGRCYMNGQKVCSVTSELSSGGRVLRVKDSSMLLKI